MLKVSSFNPIMATLLLIGYLFLSVFSIFHMAHMNERGMPMSNCPYMIGEHSLCQMNTSGHLTMWQHQFTTAVFPTVIALLSLAVVAITFQRYFSPPDPLLLYAKKRRQNFLPLHYQDLFSQGILNPKLY
ncbi:MAG: hypothetical protein ABIO57_00390 [Candidatus Paceibacterota bacterium]